LVSYCSL